MKRCLTSSEIQMKMGRNKVRKWPSQEYEVLSVHINIQKASATGTNKSNLSKYRRVKIK